MRYCKIKERVFIVESHKNTYLILTYPLTVFKVSTNYEQACEYFMNGIPFEVPAILDVDPYPNFYSLDWLITADCNLNCKHCFAKKPGDLYRYGLSKKTLSKEEIHNSIVIACNEFRKKITGKDKAKFELFIIGGEPLLEKKLICDSIDTLKKELDVLSKELNVQIELYGTIVSNGIELDAPFAKYCSDNNLHLSISVDSPDCIQKIDSEGNCHTNKVIENIRTALSLGTKVAINFVIDPEHITDAEKIMDYYDTLGILNKLETVQISPKIPPSLQTLHCGCRQEEVIISEFQNSPESCDDFSKMLNELKMKYGIDLKQYRLKIDTMFLNGGSTHRCPGAISKFCIVPGGDVYPCHQLVNIGGYKMGNIHDNWYTTEKSECYRLFKKRMVFDVEPCKDCVLQSICLTFVDCPARCVLESGDINIVPSHYCRIAKGYLLGIFEEILMNRCP